MPVHFKGVTEYRREFRRPKARSRSASPHRKMLLAGLRSTHQGISREPQFLSRRRIPTHPPQVSTSLLWDELSEQSRPEPAPPPPPPAPAELAAELAAEEEPLRPRTPLAPREPQAPLASAPEEQPQQPHQHQPPVSTDQKLEFPIDGVQHVLMRQAGLKPSRGAKGRQQHSEYQRQFEWKERVANSPLLAAEQALHSSKVLPVHASNPVPIESEYSRNFKGSPPPRPPRLRRDVEQNEIALFQREKVPPEMDAKVKRKKRKEQLSDRKRHNSTEEAMPCQTSKPTLRDLAHITEQPTVPHQGGRKMKTEYNTSYRSPRQYNYEDGAWVKVTSAAEEVRELREKAAVYRRRAWGTHFSRQHLNQIMSEHNHLWEPSTPSDSASISTPDDVSRSTSSPGIEALDLARVGSGAGSVSSAPSAGQGSTRGQLEAPTAPGPPKQAWSASAEPEKMKRDADLVEKSGIAKKEQRVGQDEEEEEENRGQKEAERLQESEGSSSSREGGRLPTPKLKTLALTHRTHHDRTTPATGGALLVSPPRARAALAMRERKSPSPQRKAHSPQKPMAHISSSPAPTKVEEGRLTRTPPTAGLITVDPLPLRQDAWGGEGPSKEPTRRSPRKQPPHSAQVWAAGGTIPINRIQGALRNPEFQHNGNLGIQRRGLFVYPLSDLTDMDDDGRMSQISARSAASCSMAAQVLGRARQRKEEFWGES